MARKKQLIVPVFIPFGGCPNQCVFCDQKGITGEARLPERKDVIDTIEAYLSTWRGKGIKEVAFYGGSFTGLPKELQLLYLDTAYNYVKAGRIDRLRLSTRPDYINEDILRFLKVFRVETVELGVQSMSDTVLKLSGRGHTASDTIRAVRVIGSFGIKAGIQFMPGLPGDTVGTVLKTTEDIIGLSPAFVRIYPTLVLKDTPLYRMYLDGRYTPWGLDEMTALCKKAARLLKDAGIPIIKMGLQPTEGLVKNLAAGPYHPSFRQLVEGCPV